VEGMGFPGSNTPGMFGNWLSLQRQANYTNIENPYHLGDSFADALRTLVIKDDMVRKGDLR
jgi:hypothetical protein